MPTTTVSPKAKGQLRCHADKSPKLDSGLGLRLGVGRFPRRKRMGEDGRGQTRGVTQSGHGLESMMAIRFHEWEGNLSRSRFGWWVSQVGRPAAREQGWGVQDFGFSNSKGSAAPHS